MDNLPSILAALMPYIVGVGGGGILAYLVQWRQTSQSNQSLLWTENRELRKEITALRLELAEVKGELAQYKAERQVDDETLIARVKTECPEWRTCPLLARVGAR